MTLRPRAAIPIRGRGREASQRFCEVNQLNRPNLILVRAAFGTKSLHSLCSLVFLLTAVAFSSACGKGYVVSETPLLINAPGQCDDESKKDNVKKHKTLVAEGFILYVPPKAGEMIRERNTKTGQTRTRTVGAYPEEYRVVTQSGDDTGLWLSTSFSIGYDFTEIASVLKKYSSADKNNLSPVRLRIIASTYSCGLGKREVIKIEEADTSKLLYEDKTASRPPR